MLVKILSFIASVMSNARYKAVLIPCIIVVLSVTSLTAVALVHESGSHSAASTAGKTIGDTNGQQATSPQVNGGVQNIKDGSDKPVSSDGQQNGTAGSDSPSGKPSASANPSPASTDIVLTSSAITVEADSTSSSLTATASDNSALTWSITPESNDAAMINVATEKTKEPSANFSFRFRAAQGATSGQYQFTVTAKDANRGLNVSKVVTITVVQ